MKFEIPSIYEEIKLSEYAREFSNIVILVRVNPPRVLLNELYDSIQANKINDPAILSILADLWKDWSIEDIKTLIQHSMDTDPTLITWLVLKTFRSIRDHRLQIKKNWMPEHSKQPEQEKQE